MVIIFLISKSHYLPFETLRLSALQARPSPPPPRIYCMYVLCPLAASDVLLVAARPRMLSVNTGSEREGTLQLGLLMTL